MQNTEVHKIGGSVLKDPAETKIIIKRLISTDPRKLVVVSALFGVTDLINRACNSTKSPKKQIKELRSIHDGWINFLIEDADTRQNLKNKTNDTITEISEEIELYTATESQHKLALILSYGERLSAIILSSAIKQFVKSSLQCPGDFDLKTTGEPLSSSFIDLNVSKLKRSTITDKITIVPGFYGISEKGNICLVGRGGSDYSAAFIAAKLNASKLVFWKDTQGVRSADPKSVGKTQLVKHLNFNALSIMEQTGAAIIHPRVTQEIKNTDIQIHFNNPNTLNNPVTIIQGSGKTTEKPIIITTGNKQHLDKYSGSALTILSRNIPAALILVSQWKTRHPSSKIINYSDHHIKISVREDSRTTAAQFFHNGFYVNKEASVNIIRTPQII
ncbi:MAG TPA: hypothetical protein VJ937_06860 [Salinivirga sp.]|uniref:amino acid kinase family protein n=1 Tax=Salinivirga sp. TaxID=1970192 RepID=UPI002B4603BB|nr:hypothetical protein [Salinivirga sp.]HKK59180.1 hypothetical protein [Salinivirga sp.]